MLSGTNKDTAKVLINNEKKKKPDPLDNLYDHFKDDPHVDQNFLKYRIAREKEKRTLRYKIRCFLAKFHR